jgi:hypothetical protein
MFRHLVPLAGLVAVAACASIIHGGHENVTFGTTPPGAKVVVDDSTFGVTPTTVTLARKRAHTLRIELAGYKPYELKIRRRTSDWVFGNLFLGGVIGVAIDLGTGAMFKLSPKDVQASLTSAADSTASITTHGDRLIVAVVLRPDPSWQKVGQLTRY